VVADVEAVSSAKKVRFCDELAQKENLTYNFWMAEEHANGINRQEVPGEKPPTPVDGLIFSRRWVLSPLLYEVYRDAEDTEAIEAWKREIDEDIAKVREKSAAGSLKASERRALGEHPSDRDIILFCIARFLRHNQKSEGFFEWKFVKKFVPGGRHHIRELGKHFDSCVDTSAVAKVLAEEYGIQGEIVPHRRMIHYYWQASDGNREIIDSLWLKRNTGYARTPEDYARILKSAERTSGSPKAEDEADDV
jgi:hypothetical protein